MIKLRILLEFVCATRIYRKTTSQDQWFRYSITSPAIFMIVYQKSRVRVEEIGGRLVQEL